MPTTFSQQRQAPRPILGHSAITLTADLYGHLMPDDTDKVADAMDRALGA
ncbi:MAG: hypothetical protein ACKVHU_02090 [Acidimicrobiales bacterium]|jgi:hypothetical protein